MNSVITVGQRTQREALSALERTVVGILLAMVLIWTAFQVMDVQSLFPPIGILYALGSIIVAAVILLNHKSWSPALAAGWAVLMLIPETVPAVRHLIDWSDIYTHFGHYLIIMTFFPLAIALMALGVGSTIQNRRHEAHDRHAPSWLSTAMPAMVALIIVANAVVVALYLLEIP